MIMAKPAPLVKKETEDLASREARVERIKPHERLAHAVNAIGFLLAAGTGLVLLYKGLKKLSGGTRSRQLHRVGAALMIVAPFFVWLKDWNGWRDTWREITHFTKEDREF